MSKKIKKVDKYDATPDQLMEMMRDSAYIEGKYQALGDISFSVDEHTATDDGMVLKVSRTVPADMPGFAKKVLGETNDLVQNEKWTKDGDGYVCDLNIESPGKPLKITGKLSIQPTGDATSDWTVDMDISASVPLVGGKIEGVVEGETQTSLGKEYEYNKSWLASH